MSIFPVRFRASISRSSSGLPCTTPAGASSRPAEATGSVGCADCAGGVPSLLGDMIIR